MNLETKQTLAATAELLGATLSEGAVKVMLMDLADYSDEHLMIALKKLRQDSARFSTGEIIKRLPAMWPGAEEAWARFPRSEYDSACVCDEMLAAWGVACELDEIAGRMAFKETYNRQVSTAMSAGKKPRWIMSMGQDPSMREQATLEAVATGRLPASRAQVYLPGMALADIEALELGHTTAHQLQLEDQRVDEQNRDNRAKVAGLLAQLGGPDGVDELP